MESKFSQQQLAKMHKSQLRPLCTCTTPGAPLGITKYGDHYALRKMPGTGHRHAPTCRFYSPMPLPHTIPTQKALDTPISDPDITVVPRPAASASTSSHYPRETLHRLLIKLWETSRFNHWHPHMAGKRNWQTIRHHLLRTAETLLLRQTPLLDLLHIPSVYRTSHKDTHAQEWSDRCRTLPDGAQMLILGEVKSHTIHKTGGRLVIRHLPYLTFLTPLTTGLPFFTHDDTAPVRTLLLGSCTVRAKGNPVLHELVHLNVDENWLPVFSPEQHEELKTLLSENKTFAVNMRPAPHTQRSHHV